MRSELKNRFQIDETLRKSKNSLSFLGSDRWNEDTSVVVKFIRAGAYRPDSDIRGRLIRLRGLSHPGLLGVMNAVLSRSRDFYVTRTFVNGTQLGSHETPWNPHLTASLLGTLTLLETLGLVHGRLKPSNVIVRSEDEVTVLDAAFPWNVSEDDPGALSFVAPEVLQGVRPTFESDLYSLGALLFRAHAGIDLFVDPDVSLLRHKCAYAAPPRLQPRADISLELAAAVNGLLSRTPRSRRRAFLDLLSQSQLKPIAVGDTPFVGRTKEQSSVTDALTHDDRGLNAVFITAEAGGGKTRFLDHLQFLAELDGRHLLVGRSFERNNRPFESVVHVIRQRLRRKDSRLKAWLNGHGHQYHETLEYLSKNSDATTTLGSLNSEDSPCRGKLVADLVGILLTMSADDRSLEVAFDDLHWSDEGTIDVLEQLGWRAKEASVRIVILARSGIPHGRLRELHARWNAAHAVRITDLPLGPITTDEAENLTALYVVDAPQRQQVLELANGNPLLLHQYCTAGSETKTPTDIGRSIVIGQTRALPRKLRATAEVASLFDRPTSRASLIAVLNVARVGSKEGLDTLIDDGLLRVSNANVSFKHEAVRRTIYGRISAKRRGNLHRAAFQVLKAEKRDPAVLGFHASQARLFDLAAAMYWSAAAARCTAEDFMTSIELFREAADAYTAAGADPPAEFLLQYGRALLGAGLHRRSEEQLLKWLSAKARDPAKRSLCYLLLASCRFDNPNSALQYVRRAIDKTSPLLPRLHLAQAYAMCGQIGEARSILACTDSELSRRSSEEIGRSAIVRLSLCDYATALADFNTLNVSAAVSARVVTNSAVCLEHLGHLNDAVSSQRKALSVAQRLGLLSVELQSLVNLGAFAYKLGRMAEAEAYFHSAVRFCETVRLGSRHDWFTMPVLSSDRALYLSETGRYDLSLTELRSAIRYLVRDQSSQNAVWLAIKAAEVFRRTFDDRRANSALRRVEQSEICHCDFFIVERALITRSDESITDEHRVAQLEDCLALTEKMETLYQQCRVLIELGVTLLRLERNEECRQRLDQARKLAVRYGYAPLLAKIDLVAALASEAAPERSRLLQRAYRRSARIGLAELTAECAFRIGEGHAARKRLKPAAGYLRKSVAAVDEMAGRLPDALKKRYLAGGWHSEARSLLEEVETRVRKTEPRALAVPAVQVDPLFRSTYHTSVRLNRAKEVDEVIDILGQTLARDLRMELIVFLTARDEKEFHRFGRAPDKQVESTIRKLDRTVREEAFFALPLREKGSREGLEAWAPLRFQRHRFGGVYVRMARPPTEREIEFLTTLTASAATTLAALLWSADPPPETSAVHRYKGIVGRSAAIRDIGSQIGIAARSTATVLIEGESGTGKELVAQAIHDSSSRSKGPFVAVDCGAIPETLIESELFGSCRGSFTGATTDRTGLIEASHKGTLFLDEIANTSPAVQAKLLRVLQEREVRRIGDTRGRKVDARLIAATNADLDLLVAKSEFRQDLLYRLKVLHIRVPPLRQRREDIPDIAQAFLKRMNGEHGTRKRLHKSALATLAQGTYRGNVRELLNVIERAYFSSPGQDVITEVAVGSMGDAPDASDAEGWFERIASGKDDFWNAVHRPYKSRDISREKVRALMDVGLRETRGSYKDLARLLHVNEKEYRRFMDFLRRNDCQPDFRLYRPRSNGNRPEEPPETTVD